MSYAHAAYETLFVSHFSDTRIMGKSLNASKFKIWDRHEIEFNTYTFLRLLRKIFGCKFKHD